VTKHRRINEEIVQTSLRIPRSVWKQINRVAEMKRLSMAQAVERAIFYYCFIELPFNEELDHVDLDLAVMQMKLNIERRESEMKRKKRK